MDWICGWCHKPKPTEFGLCSCGRFPTRRVPSTRQLRSFKEWLGVIDTFKRSVSQETV